MLTELGWPVTADEVVGLFMGRSLASELEMIADQLGRTRPTGSSTTWCRG